MIRLVTATLIGLALGAVLFTAIPSASSEDGDPGARRAQSNLVQSVRSAVASARPGAFRLIVVSTGADTYIETFGDLDEEAAAVLARKLHALGELTSEGDDWEEEHEEEHDDEDDEHEDDDDEGHEDDDDRWPERDDD